MTARGVAVGDLLRVRTESGRVSRYREWKRESDRPRHFEFKYQGSSLSTMHAE